MHPLLISVHIPKTAGTSLRASLDEHFGDRFITDYEDRPLGRTKWQRNLSALQHAAVSSVASFPHADCIHGHFLATKYALRLSGRKRRFTTWLRDPVDRVISHYNYWKQTPLNESATQLRRQMVEEDWTLEQFARHPRMRNLYCQFLWAFNPERFDFIGITERFDQDFPAFAQRFLQQRYEPKTLNVTPRPEADNPSLRHDLEKINARDVELYRWALKRKS